MGVWYVLQGGTMDLNQLSWPMNSTFQTQSIGVRGAQAYVHFLPFLPKGRIQLLARSIDGPIQGNRLLQKRPKTPPRLQQTGARMRRP